MRDDDVPADADLVEPEDPGALLVAGDARSPRWHRTTKIAAGVALVVAGLGATYLARNALTLVALAGLIAFLVAPLIRVLHHRARFPRPLALLSGYAVALAALVVVGGLVVAGIAGALSEIDPPEAAAALRAEATTWLTQVRAVELWGYELDLSEPVDSLTQRIEALGEEAADADDRAIPIREDQLQRLAGGLLSSVQAVGGVLAALLATVLVAIYMSADTHRFHRAIRSHVPDAYEGDADRVAARLGEIWRGYLYGQLLNSLATGLLVWLVLWLVGLPGAFVFGLIMALLNMIPTFGPIIAAVPGILAALALGSTRLDWSMPAFALLVGGIYLLVVQLQANLMAPFITGKAVQMSPATILVGLVVGFQVGGLVGSLLVVPVLATLKEIAKYVLAKLLDRDPFEETAPT